MLLLFGGVAYFFDKVYLPRSLRAQIIEALEVTERIGISNIGADISDVAKRWNLLGVGIKDNESYDLGSYVPRMESAIKLMEPFEDRLRKQISLDNTSILLRGIQ
jgi:hypothetical protein